MTRLAEGGAVRQAANNTPGQRYRRLLELDGFIEDQAQAMAVEALDAVYRAVLEEDRRAEGRVARWLRRRRGIGLAPPRGLYLWGGVGRGKTFLMDVFYESLPFDDKQRLHFHRFMRRTHRALTGLAGIADPLQRVADDLAAEARVLCFDEFFVSDIGDAMILGELMTALFHRGVALVATSNLPPERLYENGLQRRRFLPVIDLLQEHTRILNLDGHVDYRLRVLERAEIYHCPLDDAAEVSLADSFAALAPEEPVADVVLDIERRPIRAQQLADDVAWFEFDALCDGPRSQNDYIELARIFHAVLVSRVPVFDSKSEDQARRFISLVDELYDHSVKLIVSAAAPPEELYRGRRLTFEFRRTASRLLEMQSHAYLSQTHRASY